MAGTKSKVSTSTKSVSTTMQPVQESEGSNNTDIKTTEKKQYKVIKNLDPNTIVTVVNGYQGRLVYKSKRTNERFEWDCFGDEQDMTLQELKNAKNASKSFFINNWFLIDDPEILEYLGVTQYYKYALNFESFDSLFEKAPAEIKSTVALLSSGQKKTVAYRAKELIATGVIDSIKIINALEDVLAVELIDRE